MLAFMNNAVQVEDVLKLKGSIDIEHTLATRGANKVSFCFEPSIFSFSVMAAPSY